MNWFQVRTVRQAAPWRMATSARSRWTARTAIAPLSGLRPSRRVLARAAQSRGRGLERLAPEPFDEPVEGVPSEPDAAVVALTRGRHRSPHPARWAKRGRGVFG